MFSAGFYFFVILLPSHQIEILMIKNHVKTWNGTTVDNNENWNKWLFFATLCYACVCMGSYPDCTAWHFNKWRSEQQQQKLTVYVVRWQRSRNSKTYFIPYTQSNSQFNKLFSCASSTALFFAFIYFLSVCPRLWVVDGSFFSFVRQTFALLYGILQYGTACAQCLAVREKQNALYVFMTIH